MQAQSNAYREALYGAYVVQSTITGSITASTGEIYDLTDNDIIPGSLNKNNKCVNGSSFELGSVFQGELNVTLRKTLDRYRINGGSITFTEHRYLKDGTAENVKIGKFYIASADRKGKLTTIKAVDRMDLLEIDVSDNMVGTPYELLLMLSEKCGVELAQTEEEIMELPNGSEMFSVYVDTTGTYRDMAAYLGMVTGTFVTINVDDKLELRQYALTDCMEVPSGKRSSGSTVIADYVTYYRGVTARFIAENNYAAYTYEDSSITGGLMLDLGDIPIVRGLPERKHAILESLFSVIKQIVYIPAEFTLVTSDSALELGDRIGIGGENISTYVTSYNWIYHGSEKIKGAGDNPRLKAAGDKNTKRLANMEEEIKAKDIVVHSYTNASALTIGAEEQTIITFNFATIADTHPVFLATVPLTMNRDGNLVLRYYLDGVPGDVLREYLQRGEHFVTLSSHFAVEKDKRIMLQVTAATEYHDSDTRRQAAAITALEKFAETGEYAHCETDKSIPAAGIARGTIRAVLYAQGMAGAAAWDGTITVSEAVAEIGLPMLPMAGTAAVPRVSHVPLKRQGISAPVPAMELRGLALPGISAGVSCTTETA